MEEHLKTLEFENEQYGFVEVMSNCRHTICSILICLCFGARISKDKLNQEHRERTQRCDDDYHAKASGFHAGASPTLSTSIGGCEGAPAEADGVFGANNKSKKRIC